MHKIFTFLKDYATELILILAVCVLLVVFQVLCQMFSSPWIHTIIAAAIPIIFLRVLIACPLEMALYRNSDTYILAICSLAILVGLLMTTYPSSWVTALLVIEVAIMGFLGLLIMAFITSAQIDPYS